MGSDPGLSPVAPPPHGGPAAVQEGLAHAALLFVCSYIFGALVAMSLGDLTSSQPGMLAHLVGQQIIVVGGLSSFWIVATGVGARGALGRASSPAHWFVGVVLIAAGFALLQVPVVEAWAGTLGLSPPSWYQVALTLGSPGVTVAVFVSVAMVPALCEELFFRGYLLARFRALPVPTAIGLQALLFALYHLDLYGLPVYLASGVVLGLVRHYSGALWPAVLLHAANNVFGILDIDRGAALYDRLSPWGAPIALTLLVSGAAVLALAVRAQAETKV